jgi:small basic protein (TIGR04137 family)
MSLDKSLKTLASLTRHRNVLTRYERIEVLKEEERWTEGRKPIALPKIAHRKVNVGGKEKKSKAAEAKAGEKGKS